VNATPLPPLPLEEADLREEVDLPLDLRREILALEARLPETMWEVLGLPWNASATQARAAYLDRIRQFHPDRYGGRRLGSFKGRLDRIVQRLTEARDLLTDERRREAYARETAAPEELARLEARRLDEALRSEERRARLARSASLVGTATRAGELVRRGRAALEEGRHGEAANDFLTAASLDPRNAEVRQLARQAREKQAAQQGRANAEEAEKLEKLGQLGAARERWSEAARLCPAELRYQVECARLARRHGDLEEARRRAETAAQLAPADARAQEALGLALAAEGRALEAKRALRRALRADGSLEEAREQLRRLRWRFFG
jgi:tetratricopeptide (TPR) repeat protein